MMSVSHIAEVAALLAVSYVVGLVVGIVARRLTMRQTVQPAADVAGVATVAAAPVDALAVAAPAEPTTTVEPATALGAAPVAPGGDAVAVPEAAPSPAPEVTEQPAAESAVSAQVAPVVAEATIAPAEPVKDEPVVPPAPTIVGPIVVDDTLVPFDRPREQPATVEVAATPPPSPDELLAALATISGKPETGAEPAAEQNPASAEIPVVVAATEPVTSVQGADERMGGAASEDSSSTEAALPPPLQAEDLIAALSAVAPAPAAADMAAAPTKIVTPVEALSGGANVLVAPIVATDAGATPPEAGVADALAGTMVQPVAEAMASEVIAEDGTPVAPMAAEMVPAAAAASDAPAPVPVSPPTPAAPVAETAKVTAPVIATAPSNFDDLLSKLTSIAAKARAVRDGNSGASGSAGGGTSPPPTAARPARVPGFAWGGTIRGKSATVYVAKAGPLQRTSTATPPAPPPVTQPSPVRVAGNASPPPVPAAPAVMSPPPGRPEVSDASVRAALFETLASELEVTLPPASARAEPPTATTPPIMPETVPAVVPTPAPEEGRKEAVVNTAPASSAPSSPEPAALPIAPAAMDEDDAMRAIEGGWSRTRARALGGTPELSDLGAAVSAAQIAVETVLARNGIDPGDGAAAVKPKGLPKPRNGKRDNLQSIKGIGALDEIALNNLGIFHFDQVAEWNQKSVLWLENHAFARGRIAREDWQAQARALLGDVGDLKVGR